MPSITCKEATDRVIEQNGFEGLTAESFNADSAVSKADDVDMACRDYAEEITDEDRFWV